MNVLWRCVMGGWLVIWAIGSSAAIYTVGPGGSHTTLQTAIDAAQATSTDDEIRLRGIDLAGNVLFQSGFE